MIMQAGSEAVGGLGAGARAAAVERLGVKAAVERRVWPAEQVD